MQAMRWVTSTMVSAQFALGSQTALAQDLNEHHAMTEHFSPKVLASVTGIALALGVGLWRFRNQKSVHSPAPTTRNPETLTAAQWEKVRDARRRFIPLLMNTDFYLRQLGKDSNIDEKINSLGELLGWGGDDWQDARLTQERFDLALQILEEVTDVLTENCLPLGCQANYQGWPVARGNDNFTPLHWRTHPEQRMIGFSYRGATHLPQRGYEATVIGTFFGGPVGFLAGNIVDMVIHSANVSSQPPTDKVPRL